MQTTFNSYMFLYPNLELWKSSWNFKVKSRISDCASNFPDYPKLPSIDLNYPQFNWIGTIYPSWLTLILIGPYWPQLIWFIQISLFFPDRLWLSLIRLGRPKLVPVVLKLDLSGLNWPRMASIVPACLIMNGTYWPFMGLNWPWLYQKQCKSEQSMLVPGV